MSRLAQRLPVRSSTRERGSGTVLVGLLGMTAVWASVAVWLLLVYWTSQQEARSGADLAALAAAGEFAEVPAPCLTAGRIASANGLRLSRCESISGEAGSVVTVVVERRVPVRVPLLPTLVSATAHAGSLR